MMFDINAGIIDIIQIVNAPVEKLEVAGATIATPSFTLRSCVYG
jgi:hypothetical protein